MNMKYVVGSMTMVLQFDYGKSNKCHNVNIMNHI